MKDYLSRDKDKEQIINLINSANVNNQKLSFAINARWGAGKTHFLKMIIEDLKSNHYVFYYDSWENDYYDDPLIGMLDCLKDELNKIIADEKALEIANKKIAKKALDAIVSFLDSIAKNKIGFKPFASLKKAIEFIKECYKEAKIPSDFNEYDKIKVAKALIVCTLNKLSRNKPIVFIVDELDRCLPTYALKIIERIHHISESVNRCVTIFAVDADQLKKVIDTLYHFDDTSFDSRGYLRKIIDFTYELGNGKTSDDFIQMFEEYSARFDAPTSDYTQSELNGFIKNMFDGLEFRTIEKITNAAFSTHCLAFGDNRYPLDFMFTELFVAWAVSKYPLDLFTNLSKAILSTTVNTEPFIDYLKTPQKSYYLTFFDKGWDVVRVNIYNFKTTIVYYILTNVSNYSPYFPSKMRSIPEYFANELPIFANLISKINY